MSNSIFIPAQRMCTKCNYIGLSDAKSCKGCGASFVFGVKDTWESTSLLSKTQLLKTHKCCGRDVLPGDSAMICDCGQCTIEAISGQLDYYTLKDAAEKLGSKQTEQCLWDGVPPGQPMGMVCMCPKCAPYSMGTYNTSIGSQTL